MDRRQQRVGALTGVLLGTALGDALGLPAEGLSAKRIAALGWRGHWRHRLILGQGLVSDDTEHTLLVAECLLRGGDPATFRRCLAWRLRWWLANLPAGVGMATGRAIIKLWLGFPPHRSGIDSAGNGPAMRSAVIGVIYGDQPETLALRVADSTRITHTDPRALTGAWAVALAAAMAANGGERSSVCLDRWRALAPDDAEWQGLLRQLADALDAGTPLTDFSTAIHPAAARGKGRAEVSGYVYHTVPVALLAWLRHATDLETALTEVLDLGGDTDTVGAITGALVGCQLGAELAESGIQGWRERVPSGWIEGLRDQPLSLHRLLSTADALAALDPSARTSAGGELNVHWTDLLRPPRNLLFLLLVLAHGLVRLLPARLARWIWWRDCLR